MLFILTGNVQIGKSRWLERLADDLTRLGVTCYGVIAPGIWVESNTDAANDQGYEKLGINNLLLPDNVTVFFAQRADIARANGTYADLSQAGRVGLGWHIDDAAIARVNEHLSSIEKRAEDDRRRKLLVIDELGPRARSRIGSCRGDEVAAQWPLRGYEGRARGSSRNLCRTCRIPFCRNLERRPTHCAHPARRGIGQTSPGGIEPPKE